MSLRLSQILNNTFVTPFSGVVMVLCMVAFLSALGVVMVKDQYRQAYISEQKEIKIAEKVHTQWLQLLLEEGTWGSNHRIEDIATQQMGMVVPTEPDTDILVLPGAHQAEAQSKKSSVL